MITYRIGHPPRLPWHVALRRRAELGARIAVTALAILITIGGFL